MDDIMSKSVRPQKNQTRFAARSTILSRTTPLREVNSLTTQLAEEKSRRAFNLRRNLAMPI